MFSGAQAHARYNDRFTVVLVGGLEEVRGRAATMCGRSTIVLMYALRKPKNGHMFYEGFVGLQGNHGFSWQHWIYIVLHVFSEMSRSCFSDDRRSHRFARTPCRLFFLWNPRCNKLLNGRNPIVVSPTGMEPWQ